MYELMELCEEGPPGKGGYTPEMASNAKSVVISQLLNTLRPRQMTAIFQTTFQMYFLEWKCISITISLMFAPKGQINNVPASG